MTKDEIRKQTLIKRDGLTAEEIKEKSRAIFEKLIDIKEYKEADNILVYASMRSEVITDDIILDSLSQGKRVFCPKVTDRDAGEMKFIRIYSLEDLKEGYFGIPEPGLDEDSEIAYGSDRDMEESVLAVIPGVAFDKSLNRIGYSGGFYDRFLAGRSDLKTVALGFECQICDTVLPAEPFDIKPDMIISEEEILIGRELDLSGTGA